MLLPRLLTVAFCVVLSSTAFGQTAATDKDIYEQRLKGFEAERAEAIKQGFKDADLKNADDLKELALKAAKLNNIDQANRTIREARFLVPYLPADLPPHVSKILGSPRLQQTGAIYALALHPKEAKCVVAAYESSKEGSVAIWDFDNGRQLLNYRAHTGPCEAAAWSSDGKWIATSGGNEIHIWDPKTGKTVHVIKDHKGVVNNLAFSRDGKKLASSAEAPDITLRLWEVESGKSLGLVVTEKSRIYRMAFTEDGQQIGLVDSNGAFKLYPAAAASKDAVQKSLFSLNVHSGFGAFSMAFSTDGKSVFTGGDDNTIKQTPIPTMGQAVGKNDRKMFLADASNGLTAKKVSAVAVSPDGKYLASGDGENTVKVWDLARSSLLRTFFGHTDEISGLAFTNDSRTLVSTSKDQTIRVWNISSTDSHSTLSDQQGSIWTCAYSPDGKYFATGGADHQVFVYEAATFKEIVKISAHDSAITALVFTPDSRQLVTAGGDRLIRLWDLPDGKKVREFKGHTGPVMALAIDAAGKQLLSGSTDKTAIVWDIGNDRPVTTIGHINSTVSAVDFSPNGKWLAIGSADGMLRLYDRGSLAKESSKLSAHLSGVAALQFHPSEPSLATVGGDRMLRFWSINDKGALSLASEIAAHTHAISALAYNKDGTSIATGGGDQLLKIWNVQTRTERTSLRGHTDWVTNLAFAPDGSAILSTAVDRTARIWTLASSESKTTAGHKRQVTALSILPDGTLASGSDDRTVKIWDLKSGKEVLSLSMEFKVLASLTLLPDGKRIAIAGGPSLSSKSPIQIWNLEKRQIDTTVDDVEQVPVMAADPAGKRFLVWSFNKTGTKPVNRMELYDADFKQLKQVTERELNTQCLNFSLDGTLVAMGTTDNSDEKTPGGLVRVWNIDTGEKLLKADLKASKNGISDLSFSPDKKTLYVADQDGIVKLWSLPDGKEGKSFQANTAGDTQIAIFFAGEKSLLASFNNQGEVCLWDLKKLEKIRDWKLPTKVNALVFTPDGKHIVTANADSTIFVLDTP